jgi:hypothetical protein
VTAARSSPTTSRSAICCRRRSCGVRMPTPASCASTRRGPYRSRAWRAC